jgi:hypothetical protein
MLAVGFGASRLEGQVHLKRRKIRKNGMIAHLGPSGSGFG